MTIANLNLRTKIDIDNEEHVFQIHTMKSGVITEIILDNYIYCLDGELTAKKPAAEHGPYQKDGKTKDQGPSSPMKITAEPRLIYSYKKTRGPSKRRGAHKIPHLLKWIVEKNIHEFTLEDFYRAYPKQREQSQRRQELYISRLIKSNKLVQISNDKFMVVG
jgi:hypothetical protein